jgi:hypothetical protein
MGDSVLFVQHGGFHKTIPHRVKRDEEYRVIPAPFGAGHIRLSY